MSIFKKALKTLTGSIGAIGAQLNNTVRTAGNVGSGILTGNTDKIESNLKRYANDYVQNTKAYYGSAQNILGKNGPQNALQIDAQKQKDAMSTQEASLAAEVAAAPEKERQERLSKRYQNSLLQGGGRNYGTLLGGGF